MTHGLNPERRVQELRIGRENAPLLIIDDLFTDAEALIEQAAAKPFGDVTSYYPGVRAKVPLSYQALVIEQLGPLFVKFFEFGARRLRFTACHFSLVTTPPEELGHLQRIPHIDSVSSDELAFVHYLFKNEHGGTAFFRHRSTGFEFVDAQRQETYFARVEDERLGPHSPPAAYIAGSTALYEEIARHDGVFNRMLVYRRNSLHSAALATGFRPDPDPRTGRLSINGFIA